MNPSSGGEGSASSARRCPAPNTQSAICPREQHQIAGPTQDPLRHDLEAPTVDAAAGDAKLTARYEIEIFFLGEETIAEPAKNVPRQRRWKPMDQGDLGV